ncbi:MAG: hypothetical protein ACXADC_13305 [Candidatus Thorarchaeota archaeon]|jgi:hypothetical protein
MNQNEDDAELSQFDRRQFWYLNLSCLFAILALIVLLANPVWGFLIALFLIVMALVLVRACFTHEVIPTDDNRRS